MTTEQAAARLHLKAATVKIYCALGKIAGVKRGTKRRGTWDITEDALAAFITTRQIGPGNKTGQPRTTPATPPAGTRGTEEG